jgi:uncharacterized peroxidase-related enzyme
MWISSIPYDGSSGELRAHYDRQARALGEPAEMTMAGSLYPAIVGARLDLYAVTERCPSRLTRHQRNLIRFVTSALNRSRHCVSQQSIKLRSTGLTDDEIDALADDPASLDLADADAAVVAYTAKLTREPGSVTEADIDRLRTAGFDDLDILDINSQCAHLNYANRVVLGLGIRTIVDPDFPAQDTIPPLLSAS